MATLADYIEEYLKKLLSLSGRGYIDIQRSEIAEKFSCVPSQINYVLATRFTLEKGYLVESRRGGRGYVRVMRLNLPRSGSILTALEDTLDGDLSVKGGQDLVRRLYDERVLTQREARMAQAVVKAIPESEHLKGLRRELLKSMLVAVLKA